MSSGSISVTHLVQNTIFHHWKWHDGNRLRSLTRSHFHLSGTGMSLKSDTEFPRAAADLWPAVRSFFDCPTSDRRSGLMYWSSDGVGCSSPQEPGGTLLARSQVVFLINNNNNNNNILCCQRGVFTRVFTSEPFQRRASLSSRGDLLRVDDATQLMIYKCSPFRTLGLWSVVQQTGRGWHWDKWNGILSGSFVVLRCVGAAEPRRGKCINPG